MAPESPPPRIHGRARELGVIGTLLDRARDGHGGALAIVGDAGTGRTALLDAAARRAAPGFRVLGTTGVRREAAVPYAGLHRLLRPLAGLFAELPAAHRDALGAVTRGGRGGTPFVLYAAVCELLSRAAEHGPVLCRADDVQWLDPVSLEALAFAARRVQHDRIAMLFAARGGHGDPDGLAGIRRLHLPPLDEDASRRVLQDALGEAMGCAVPYAAIGGDLAEEVIDLACGRPLAIRDLAAALTPGQLSGTVPPPRSLPAGSSLRSLNRHRYLRLPPGARRLVLMVLADEWVNAATVARATRTGGIGPADLDAARASGLLRFEGDAVTVRNRLVRSSLWADASREERQEAHALLAEVLVQEWQAPARLWHRAAVTGEPDPRIADGLAAAARAAQEAGRYADSWRVWQRAAALTGEDGARTDRLLSAAGDAWASGRSRRARSLLRQVRQVACGEACAARADGLRGEIEAAAGSPAAAVPMLRDAAERLARHDTEAALGALAWAAEAADASGDHGAYLEIADRAATLPGSGPDAAPRSALLLAHLTGTATAIRGRYAEAAEHLRRAVLLGAEATDPAAQTWAALSAFMLGDGAATRSLADAAVASARRAGNAPLESYALMVAGRCEALLGHPPGPIAACHDGLRLARAAQLHAHTAEQLATLALTAAFNGDDATAQGHLDRLTGPTGGRGITRAAAFGSWAPAALDLAADRPADAAARLRLPGGAGLAHPPARLLAVPHLVEALVHTGRREQAAEAFEHYRRWADGTPRAPGRTALARRCQALLAARDAEAAEHFTEALRLHEAAGAVFDLARTELLFGHRLRRGRRPRAAREHLRAALRIFERYDAVPWTARARAELRAAGETIAPAAAETAPPPSRAGTDGGAAPVTADGFGELTAQQAHIARLAAEGATNREIAARLLLSPRTIDHHLRNVFTRLGIRSRVELARLIR
ncbi:helix-turn-helix transcriptional regulator [Actinomadura livida]|uniref:DNA-binding CsgD family transcriptional regulator/tetratricopeptide (TPR) repeat protein n=1 Tax=Actinomadura livida TaxID=79909 RepID=A0A7W7N120_9ACTN|nr:MULTISPECIES: LuxR family transcriptional regulator [Actinomadura]MBB4777709.1 DNA-binding CsgD family transcriptional regulator/tetratricopeptide (TPR) repeat protein [Actinomadura catellatispora]GGT99253.1 LuxR family transcriptional regulator [Actinomadura livida]